MTKFFFVEIFESLLSKDRRYANNLKGRKNENFLAPILKFVLFHCNLCLNTKFL
jgi:hypothetical protein